MCAHLDTHGGYVAWSGGKDSTVVAALASTLRPGTPLVTFVAGTEYPEVLPYCARLVETHGWRWEQVQTVDVRDLLDGGVRPSSQGEWWDAMIDGPSSIAHERYGAGLLWGMRGHESRARMALLARHRGTYTRRSDGVTTMAPLWDWHTPDVYSWLVVHGVELCPVYGRMADIGMPVDARRVGRIIGRRNMGERMRWLAAGWPDVHADYRARWPWLTREDS